MIDVCIYDSIGMGFDMLRPLGGSEVGLVLLADGLRKEGLTVSFDPCDCKALIVSRYSDVPNVKAYRTVIYAADIYDDRYKKHFGYPIQCVSNFQADWFRAVGHTDVHVIRPILGKHVRKQPQISRWIYPCAVGKGLYATLKEWKKIANGRTLSVTTTGYDEPDLDLCFDHDAVFIGRFTPEGLSQQIAISEGMFYRNTAPECYPMTVAIAKYCGLELDLSCVGHDHCGVQEAARGHDLRAETIIPQWMSFLGFE